MQQSFLKQLASSVQNKTAGSWSMENRPW